MKQSFRKAAALLLSLCMIFSFLSISASATETEETVPVLTRVEMFLYEPVVGQSIPEHYSPTVQTVPAVDYAVEGSWLVSADGENYDYIMESGAVFEEGKYYAFVIGAGGGEYEVDENTEMYLNGKVYSEQEIKVGEYVEYSPYICGPLVAGEAAKPLLEEIYIESYLPLIGDDIPSVYYIAGKTIPASNYEIAGNWFVSMDGKDYTLANEGDVFEQGGYYALGLLGTQGNFFTDENTKMFLNGEEFSYKTILVDGFETNVLFIVPCLGAGGGGDDDIVDDCEHLNRDLVCMGSEVHSPFCMDCGYIFEETYNHTDNDDNGYCDGCDYEMSAQGGGGQYISWINLKIPDPVIGQEIFGSYSLETETIPENASIYLSGSWLESIDGRVYTDIEYPASFKAGYYYAFAIFSSGGGDYADPNTEILVNGEPYEETGVMYNGEYMSVFYMWEPYTSETPCEEHTYEEHNFEPNCIEEGYTKHLCIICGYNYKDNIVDPIEDAHDYEANVTHPNCTQGGYTDYVCRFCKDTYRDDYTKPEQYAHVYCVTEGAEPTETTFGYNKAVCLECGIEEYWDIQDPTTDIRTNFNYEFTNQGIQLCDYYGDGPLTIPATFGGLPVSGFRFSYSAAITDVIIEEGITNIPYEAFCNSSITSVKIPSTVKSIDERAFQNCSSLKNVELLSGLTKIGLYAFAECQGLEIITLPETLETLESGAFSWCYSLKSITIPDSVTRIGSNAFSSCQALESVKLPENITSIERSTFSSCELLSNIEFGSKLKAIGREAFAGCSSLIKIELPESLTTISREAFYNAWRLESVTLGNSVRKIEKEAFSECTSLKSINFPKSLTTLGEAAFRNCNSLVEVDLSYVSNLGEEAFDSCSQLIKVTLSEDLEVISESVFCRCHSLMEINIPDSVTEIGDKAFQYCHALENIQLPANLEIVGDDAFAQCSALKSIDLPETVTHIGDGAFESCWQLCAVRLPEAVTYVGSYAFYGCRMQAIYIPTSVEFLGDWFIAEDSTDVTVYYEGSEEEFADIDFYPECNENIVGFVYNFDVNSCEHEKCEEMYNYGEGCLEEGLLTRTCFICGLVETEILPANGHSREVIERIESTCTEGGRIVYRCWNCGIEETEELEPLGHDYYESYRAHPSCTTDGEVHFSCSRCGDSYIEVLEAVGHSYDTYVTEPDCEQGGYTYYVCTACGDNYNSDYTDALGHDYLTEVVDPTCTQAGYTIYTCQRCGSSYWGDYTDVAEHNYEMTVVEPTCTDEGYTVYTCIDCGSNKIEDYVVPAGHKYYVRESFEPTCDKEGYTYYCCEKCGEVYSESTPAIGHNFVAGEVVPPTTTEEGYTIYTCANCGLVVWDDFVPVIKVNGVQNMQITASDTNLVVTWDAFEGADRYMFYVKNEAGETFISKQLTSDKTSYVLSWPNDIQWDETYTIGVRVRTTKWLDTVWKEAALEVAGRVVDVKTESVGKTIKVTWRAYEGATQYRVYVYRKGEYPTAFTNVKTTTNSAIIVNSIYPEVEYEVRVVATVNKVQMKTIDALAIDAKLDVYAPDAYTVRGTTPDKISIGWDEIRGADRYWLMLTDVETGEQFIRVTSTSIATVPNLTPGKEYKVRIQARVVVADGDYEYSGYSDTLGIVKTTEWETITLSATSTSSGVVLKWNSHTNASEYQIYRATGSSFKKIATVAGGAIAYLDNTAEPLTTYTYAIKVKVANGSITSTGALIKGEPITTGEFEESDVSSSVGETSSSNVSSGNQGTSSSYYASSAF